MADILAAILQNEPLPLGSYLTDAPEELQRIVSVALRKDNNERYQTMSELLVDVKNLRDELQVQSKLERSPGIAPTGNLANKQTARSEATQGVVTDTPAGVSARTNSSAEYLVHQIKSH